MGEILNSESNSTLKKRWWELPTTRAKILHILWSKKSIEYKLDEDYKWIEISPKILYRLQTRRIWTSWFESSSIPRSTFRMQNEVWTTLWFEANNESIKNLLITNWRFIHTVVKKNCNHQFEWTIKSWVKNPVNLCTSDQEPDFREYVKYNWKNYFFLSFQHHVSHWFAKEDFVLVSLDDEQWLEAKRISYIEYDYRRKVSVSLDKDKIPTLKITYDKPNMEDDTKEEGKYKYEEKFNLKDQKLIKKCGFHSKKPTNPMNELII